MTIPKDDRDSPRDLASLSCEELRTALGRGFRISRVMAELTQTHAAERLGVSNVHLCNVERGRNFPTFSLLAKAARLYGLDPYDIAKRQAKGVLPFGEDE